MAIIGITIFLLLGTLFFVGGITLVYYLFYQHIINKRLAAGVTDKKGMLAPGKLALILLGGSLVCNLVIIIAFSAFAFVKTVEVDTGMEDSDGEYLYGSERIPMLSHNTLQGFGDLYSQEENPGYKKESLTTDFFTHTCFTAEEEAAQEHMPYLLYTDFSGMPEDAVCIMECRLANPIEGMEIENPLHLPLLTESKIVIGKNNYPMPKDKMLVTFLDGLPQNMELDDLRLVVTVTIFSEENTDSLYNYLSGDDVPEDAILFETTTMFE